MGKRTDTDKKDKITVFHLIGALRVGGAERQLASIAPAFDRDRFRIIVGTVQPGGGLRDAFQGTGVPVVCLNYRTRYFIPAVLRLALLLRREKVDVLHTHMYHASWYGRIAGLFARVPVMITTDHGHDPWKKRRQIAFERYMLRHTALRVAVSEDVAKTLKARESVPDEKLLVIANAVDSARFRAGETERNSVRNELGLTDKTLLVGNVARLVEPKALHVLIEAMALLSKTIPRARLVIVGEGPLKGDLERCASDLGVSDRVTFTGARLDIPAVLAAIDIFALSSKREGLPVSLLEAMAAGKAIVTTRVGGIPEVVSDHQEALLVEPNNPAALAAAMSELASDPDLASRLGRQAAAKAGAEYSVAATVQKLEEVYCSTLRGRR